MGIKQVAARAGVSTATVSRTLHNDASVQRATAQRVWDAIRELQYVPNSNARALASGRTHILGLIISDISNPFFPELVKGFEDVAIRNNFEVIVTNTNYEPARMAICVRRMLERKVDGIAIMTSEMEDGLIRQISRHGVPMVFLDVGVVQKGISNINVDYGNGIRAAVQHLVGLGHQRIAFITGPLDLKSARLRRSAFLKTMKAQGVEPDERLVVTGDHKIDGGERCMLHLLAERKRPTAVLASNDLTAIGAMQALHMKDVHVPRDISVIGFDDISFAQFTQPPLTTVRLSRNELANVAFQALTHALDEAATAPADYRVTTDLVLRSSTGPVHASRKQRAQSR
jgi:DNA-binding LacI/PurR family transcriptional regulator